MNLYDTFKIELLKILVSLQKDGALPDELDFSKITSEPPRDPSHGDLATNAAMSLSKAAGLPPRALAEKMIPFIKAHPSVQEVSLAGAGFINITFTPAFWRTALQNLLKAGPSYGDSSLGHGIQANVEYVSTNPTGPLHIGHCRVAIVGDVLANLLKKSGYSVVKEYYVNDAGGQVNELARSLYARYEECLGLPPSVVGAYGGVYLTPPAQELADLYKDKWVGLPESDWMDFFKSFGVDAMMKMIRKDLNALNIYHDVFTSEKALVDDKKVDEALETLTQMGLIYEGILEPPKGKIIEDYEPTEQLLFRSTNFGDDTDRPLKKADGTWTYFAGDIANHFDKFQRGSTLLINVWGADHGGFVKRLSAAVTAITHGKASLNVHLCQMVKFIDRGEVLKMSKRSGVFVTVDQALEKVGQDALRFMMVWRKNDAPLDFDFDKVIEASKDNPAFYVQYAYARCQSILRYARELFGDFDLKEVNFEALKDACDFSLIKTLTSWPRQVELAALTQEPHRIAYYLYEVAGAFHALWNKGKEENHLRFVDPENKNLTLSRLTLVEGVATVLLSGLQILGVEAKKEMF